MPCWYLPAKKYAEISPCHNITFKSAAGVSHMPAGGDWESPGHYRMDIFVSRLTFVNTLIGQSNNNEFLILNLSAGSS
jgi:hypothetical protein